MDRVVDFGDVDNYESIATDQILMRIGKRMLGIMIRKFSGFVDSN